MSIDDVAYDDDRKKNNLHFDRHTPEYREQFQDITEAMHATCPLAWTDVYDGHWVAAGSNEVFELARSRDLLPASFTPGKRFGLGLDETLENLQRTCNAQELARPITERKESAVIDW